MFALINPTFKIKVTIPVLNKSLFYTIQVGRDSPVVADIIVGARKEMEEKTKGTYLAIFSWPGAVRSAEQARPIPLSLFVASAKLTRLVPV